MNAYKLFTYRQRPELIEAAEALIGEVWPEFMLNDDVADRYWGRLESDFPDFQFVLVAGEGQIAAVGNSLPLAWDGTAEGLPAGWDAALEAGFAGLQSGKTPDTLCAISASVSGPHQGKGLSPEVVRGMRRLGTRHGLKALIAPVRPSMKCRYPLIPIERYAAWQRPDNLPFDPWLRVHARLGAQILQIAPRSMVISGSVAEWEEWTGMVYPESGSYVVPEALEPLHIDCQQDRGVYVEPNVWMLHELKNAELP